ncbi:hypothetical protein ALMP_49910 [Streptomyces sp. A012304]|nr:hypothetical protein ALMP_49910 [Streptomyces sp. A012304]
MRRHHLHPHRRGLNIGVGLLHGLDDTMSGFRITLVGYWLIGLPAAWLFGNLAGLKTEVRLARPAHRPRCHRPAPAAPLPPGSVPARGRTIDRRLKLTASPTPHSGTHPGPAPLPQSTMTMRDETTEVRARDQPTAEPWVGAARTQDRSARGSLRHADCLVMVNPPVAWRPSHAASFPVKLAQ